MYVCKFCNQLKFFLTDIMGTELDWEYILVDQLVVAVKIEEQLINQTY